MRLALAFCAVAALLFVLGLFAGSGAPTFPRADAGPAPTPTPTPKPGTGGSLSGIYDLVASLIDPAGSEDGAGPGTCDDSIDNGADTLTDLGDPDCHLPGAAFSCIARLDHDIGNNVKVATVCFIELPSGPPFNAVPSLPGEGPDGVPGPPPPPPYGVQPPTKLSGSYDPTGNGTLSYIGCFPDIGGTIGPNLITQVIVENPTGQMAAADKMSGLIQFSPNQSIANCNALTPVGAGFVFGQTSFLAGGSSQVAWRSSVTDFDSDGCTDFDELAKTAPANCGDDPYNPLDSNQTDYSGTHTSVISDVRADWDTDLVQLIPGAYVNCISDLAQTGTDITLRTYCYSDSTTVTVNPEAALADTCPPATSDLCGDGVSGLPPPLAYGDVDDKHTALTGQLAAGVINVTGCFEDRDGQSLFGHIYSDVTWDASTGIGTVDRWSSQTLADCTSGDPSGVPLNSKIFVVRQSDAAAERDTDGDGCPDAKELSDDETAGGLRDPYNQWDFFDPTGDGFHRIEDILAVAQAFSTVDPNLDRGQILGANNWNLGPGDGTVAIIDIIAAITSYGHDCS